MLPIKTQQKVFAEMTMNETLNAYQNGAAETAVYPGRLGVLNGGTDPGGIYYTSLGFSGETGELLEKAMCASWVTDDILFEIGDVMWYVSQCAMELGCPLSGIYQNTATKFVAQPTQLEAIAMLAATSGKYCDCVKKCMRDNHGHISSQYRSTLFACLHRALMLVFEICGNYNIPVKRVMDMNYNKLKSRQARGKLSGDGDNR